MIPMRVAEVAEATGGQLDGVDATALVTSVATDSRDVKLGTLFVAMRGEHADGHDFAAAALASGAVAVLSARPVDGPSIIVDPSIRTGAGGLDEPVLHALGRLAHAVRLRSSANAIGITGSSGKTGTKDLVAALLGRLGPTVASRESFNNDLGVPLTVLRAEPSTAHLVLEMGSRGVGDITRLCAIARPDVGVVLNVGSAHLGEFGSIEVTAAAKSELVQALPPDGLAVLNLDDPRVAAMASQTSARVVGVSAEAATGAVICASAVRIDSAGRPAFRLAAPDGEAEVTLRLVGAHYVSNALAAAAVAHAAGMPVAAVADALSSAEPSAAGRMQVTHRADGVTVVNDAYNANPESMRAALRALVALGASATGRTWAVLGEMRELGAVSAQAHEDIGRFAARIGVARIVAVGTGARPIHAGATAGDADAVESVSVADITAAHDLLRRELSAGDVVLLKSSRDSGLRHLGERVAADSGPTA